MKQILLILLFFLFTLASHAQVRRMQVSVYFDSDKAVLRKDALYTLDHLLDSLKNFAVRSVQVQGNTDNEGDSLYNIGLSNRRNNAVIGYLKKTGFHDTLFKPKHFGENKPLAPNETAPGMQKNRRVDITVYYVPSKPPVTKEVFELDSITVVKKKEPEKDTCTGDTVLVFPDGTQVVFNRCEYLERKNCLELTEVTRWGSVRENQLTTLDVNGDPLISCGMFGIGVKLIPGCKPDDCFKHPVKVRFPVNDGAQCMACGGAAGLYNQGANGGWERDSRRLERVFVNGREFYEYLVSCPGGFKNCDCKVKARKVKIKVPRRYRFVSVTYSSDCPLALYTFEPGKRRKHVIKRRVPCFIGAGNVNAVAVDKKTGDTLLLTLRPLNDLDKKVLIAACRGKDRSVVEKRIFGFLPYKRRPLYRKYLIRQKELTPKAGN